jgi:hypothetical protein
MDEIEALLRAENPTVKDSTIKQYSTNIRKTIEEINGGGIGELSDTDAVINALDKLNFNTKRNRLNSVLKVIPKNSQEYKIYSDLRDELHAQYMDQRNTGVKNEKEEQRMVTKDEYNQVLAKLKSKFDEYKNKEAPLTKKEWKYFLAYLLLSIYKKFPVRNDFHNMKTITMDKWRNDRLLLSKKYNYIAVGNRAITFIFNNYKTAGKYGRKVLRVEDSELRKIIKEYLAKKPESPFFIVKHNGEQMSDSVLSRFITNIFLEFLNKQTGITAIRKSYLSNKYASVKDEMKKDADLMNHSVGVQQNIYVRK